MFDLPHPFLILNIFLSIVSVNILLYQSKAIDFDRLWFKLYPTILPKL